MKPSYIAYALFLSIHVVYASEQTNSITSLKQKTPDAIQTQKAFRDISPLSLIMNDSNAHSEPDPGTCCLYCCLATGNTAMGSLLVTASMPTANIPVCLLGTCMLTAGSGFIVATIKEMFKK